MGAVESGQPFACRRCKMMQGRGTWNITIMVRIWHHRTKSASLSSMYDSTFRSTVSRDTWRHPAGPCPESGLKSNIEKLPACTPLHCALEKSFVFRTGLRHVHSFQPPPEAFQVHCQRDFAGSDCGKSRA